MLPSLVGAKKMNFLTREVKRATQLPGEFWEAGVFRGGTASRIIKRLDSDRIFRLFDSFEGLPAHTPGKDNHHREGDFHPDGKSSRGWKNAWNPQTVFDYFKPYENVIIHKGWIPETFKGLEDKEIAFLHLDLDLYQCYLDTLEFVWPRLVEGGVIVFDDVGVGSCEGATKAVEEFFADGRGEVENIKDANMHGWRVYKP